MSFDSDTFFRALASSQMLRGAITTITLAVVTLVCATVLGFGLALCRTSKSRVLRVFAALYVWIFRAIPTLLWLLVFWNAIPQLAPALKQEWYSPFRAAAIAFSLSEGAYMAEIIRSAMISIDPGQRLAGRALGLKPWALLRTVIVPQVVRVAIPPTSNEFITVLKLTSLAFVISLQELMTITQQGVAASFRFAEWYAAAAIYYLVIVSVFMFAQSRLERRYQWGSGLPARRSMFRRRQQIGFA